MKNSQALKARHGPAFRFAAAAMACAAIWSAPEQAPAQDLALPEFTIPREGLEAFALCRAAVFYHLDAEDGAGGGLPHSYARTLGDQMDIVASESILGRPVATVEDGQTLSLFMERWFLLFSEALQANRALLSDVENRNTILVDCAPQVWVALRPLIDQLYAWRRKAMDPPPFLTDEALDRSYLAIERKLGLQRSPID